MRITSLMIFNQLTSHLQGNLEEYAKLNNQLATGKKINKPSDDVIGMMKAISYKVSISGNDQYKRNIAAAGDSLNYANTVMTSVSDTLEKLSELTSMGSTADETHDTYAQEAADLRNTLLDLSNSQLGGSYVFSGYKTDSKAFVYDPATNHYDYKGDNGAVNVLIDREAAVTTNIQGSKAFSFSLTGPASSTLPDGTPVNYTQSTDPATGVNTVTVEIGNAGDPGYDTFSFSNSIDLANILSSAWQYEDVNGSDLNADPVLSKEMAMHRIAALAKPLNEAKTQSLNVQSEIGTRQVQINDQGTRLDNDKLSLQNALSNTEDADMDETGVELIKIQTALQAMRSSASQILSQSLLDFLK
jgi:flagellar hook-associated protein 3 FlgL